MSNRLETKIKVKFSFDKNFEPEVNEREALLGAANTAALSASSEIGTLTALNGRFPPLSGRE